MDINFFESFATFGSIAAMHDFIVELIVKTFKIEKSWLKQLVSWVIPIAVAIVGFVLNLGMFAQFGGMTEWQGWVYTVLVGLGMGLTSNGIFDIELVKSLLNAISNLFKKTDSKQ